MTSQAQSVQPAGRTRHTDLPVGEILRRTRVHYGRSIEDVETVLRIRAPHLTALEEGKSGDLPGLVYAIGFLRSYSEYLGLDGDKMVQLFKTQSGPGRAAPELNFPVAASESKLPGWLLIGVSFAAVILAVSLFSIFHRHHAARQTAEAIPAVSAIAPTKPTASASPTVLPAVAGVQALSTAATAPSQLPAAGVAQTATLPLATPNNRIVISVKDTTWLEIRNASGKAIISRVLNLGDKYLVPNEDGLVLATGNIGGLEFTVDGKTLPALGAQGDVARGIRLDADTMKGAPRGATQTTTPAANTVEEDSAANWQGSIKQTATPTPTAAPQTPQAANPVAATKRMETSDEAYKPRTPKAARLIPADEAYKPRRALTPTAASDDATQSENAGDAADPYSHVPKGNGDSTYGTYPE